MLLTMPAPDNLVADGGSILVSSGPSVMRLEIDGLSASACAIASFSGAVSALAAHQGALAVGLDDGSVHLRGGAHDCKVLAEAGGRPLLCPTALFFEDADNLVVALGSQQHPPSMWRHDLMHKNASGSVWRVNLASGEAACLADGLAWPAGLLPGISGAITVSESWRNRLVELVAGRKPRVVLGDIAGYPGRLARAADGGAWLSVFAPRSQLVEFVLREDDYRLSMMAEIDPEYWVAPSLSPTRSSLEPMQLGGLKQLGILKPWAPTRSYGLVISLNGAHEPQASFHSRADGGRHGVTSAVEHHDRVLATSKGGDAIVSIALGPREASR